MSQKARFHPLFRKYVFGKITWGQGGQFDAPPPPRITTDRIYCIYNKTKP